MEDDIKNEGKPLYRKGEGQSLGGGLIAEVAPEEDFRALLTAVVNGKFRPCHRFMPTCGTKVPK